MNNFFDICPIPEPSSLLGFSSNEIASNAEARTPDCLSAALDNAETLYLGVCNDRILVDKTGGQLNSFFTEKEIGDFEPNYVSAIMPGKINEKPVIAIQLNIKIEDITPPCETLDARAVLYSSTLPQEDAGAIGMALSLLHWHKTNQFCGRCGAASRAQLGGMRRDCPKCKSQIFPRTDPVVIMLAVKNNKCLLGRSPHFPPNWYSCLAGFVEPGETIEQAVRRETMEESGIKVGRVRYYASQPWPFPHSLMIGAYCEALSEKISFDSDELEDCRWFERDEALSMVERRHTHELRSPPIKSIASAILRNWLEETA
ncbi:MAG: NAD(+) diphosphatase [Hyphomicrobiales bacterium]|nr:NAD(+) diphosphatase [Hyphomicrobiales bacterium]